MPDTEQQQPTFQFGVFEFNPRNGELRKHGVRVKLQEQPLQILTLLLEHAGEVVTREEIQKCLWPEGTYVEFDSAINNAIRKLRDALDDSPESPRFVETLARRGYRFIYPVLAPRPGSQFMGQSETTSQDVREPTSPVIPSTVPGIVDDCLIKDPEARLQSARDLKRELEWAKLTEGSTPNQPRKSAFWWKVLGIANAVAVLAFLGLFLRHSRLPSDTALYHVAITTPKLDLSDGGRLALSRDGRRIAFIAMDESGARHLMVRSLDSDVVQTVASATDARNYPFWSPDGQSLGYFTSNSLNTVNLSSGQVRKLAPTRPITRGASWGINGLILFTCLSGPGNQPCTIYAVPEFGGEPKSVTFPDDGKVPVYPVFLPDGKRFLFSVDQGATGREELRVGVLGGRETRTLGTIAGNVAVAAPGGLVFRRGEKLYAQRVDEKTLAFLGEPVRLVDDIRYYAINGFTSFSVSGTGLLAFLRGGNTKMRLCWFDRSGKSVTEMGQGGPYWSFDLSHDGQGIAVSRQDETFGMGQIWVGEADRGPTTRLTGSSEPEILPVWSPDGQRLCYVASRQSRWSLVVRAVHDPRQERVVLEANENLRDPTWSPDSRSLAVVEDFHGILLVPVDGTSRAIPLISSETFVQRMPQFSPNGQWIAYVSIETGGPEVYVRPFPDVNFGKWAVSTGGGLQPRWRSDGREIFYLDLTNHILAVPVSAQGKTFHAGRPTPLFAARLPWSPFGRYLYAVTPNGQRFLAGVQPEEEDRRIELLIHWDALLR